MKALFLGSLAIVMAQPAFAGSTPVANLAAEKFGAAVQVNYTRARGPYAYRGSYYHGGHGYRYPYYGYGYRYPYWGGYYGYPYAAAFAFGLGIPLAYASGYYAGAYSPGYAVYQPTVYVRERHARSSSRGSGGSFVTGVQSALKTRGYYAGSVDGVFGPQSQQALSAFQHANNLSETGLLDAPSLNALGVGLKAGKSAASPSTKRPAAPAPRQPTMEGTFVPPPIGPPDQPPGIPTESAPTPPPEPPPIATPAPAPPAQ